MKIIKSFEESGLLIKHVNEIIKNISKEHKDRFICMLLGTLRARFSKHLLTGKSVIRAGEGTVRAGKNF